MELAVKNVLTTKKPTTFGVPKIRGCYSLDSERNYHPDLSQLRYLVIPRERNARFNLNKGFEQFVDKSPTFDQDEKIDHLLKFIETHFDQLKTPNGEGDKVLPFDFVCLRGALLRTMMAPFTNEDWTICAICLKGTIYLFTCVKEQADYPDKAKFVHWGCQFKNYMFAKGPNMENDGDVPANSNEEFCVTFSSLINDISVFYGVKVDGVESDTVVDEENQTLNGVKLAEVKTNRIVTNQRNVRERYSMKALKWYCQEYLIGVEDVYIGFRDARGIVKEVVKLRIDELPRDAVGLWNKNACLNFLESFLQFVKKVIQDESDPNVAWLFDYDAQDRVVSVRKEENEKAYLFLPDWYIDLINNKDH